MYEHRSQPMLTPRRFLIRLVHHGAIALAVIGLSLALGVVGFHALAGQPWLDAFVNASMLLGGMGQVGEITRPEGKWFSALYALWAGLVIIAVTGILLAPVLHRVLHRLHVEGG